jgi:hypothetical protein
VANQIISEIILDLDKIRAQLKEAEALGSTAGKNVGEQVGGGFEKSFSFISKKLVAVALAVGAAFSLKKMIDESSAAEVALNQFRGALAGVGLFSEKASSDFVAYANNLQKITTTSSDAIIANAGLLVSLGRLSGDGLNQATKAALDLHAGMAGRIGLEQAFHMVAKAADGNVAAFGRLGIRIEETGSRAQNYRNALEALSRFSGSSERATQTWSGALTQLGNNFSDILKHLGNVFTQSQAGILVINTISKAFAFFAETIKEGIGKKDFLADAIKSFISFGAALKDEVIPTLNLFYNILKDIGSFMKTGIQAVVATATTSLYGLLEVAALFSEKYTPLRDKLKESMDSQWQAVSDSANASVATVKDTLNFGLSEQYGEMITNAQTFKDQFTGVLNELPVAANGVATKVTDNLKKITFEMKTHLGQGIASSVSIITNAMLQGQNAFAAFAKGALAVFGDLAIQLGTFFIVNGIAIDALKAISGLGAVAAGIALVALGTVMKSLGGAGGSAAGAGLGAGGGADFGGGGGVNAGSAGFSSETEERKEPATNVTVVVQGNILDRRQTGLEIAEVIQETMGSNGYTFAQAGA